MLTDNIIQDDTESTSLTADMTDDSCRLEYIEIVPLTSDADGPFTTDFDNGDTSAGVEQEMSMDSIIQVDTESTSLPADVTDDSCGLEFIEIVPHTRDTDGPCSVLIRSQLRSYLSRKMKMTTECGSGDWSAEMKQENLPVVKQEPDDVCCFVYICYLHTSSNKNC